MCVTMSMCDCVHGCKCACACVGASVSAHLACRAQIGDDPPMLCDGASCRWRSLTGLLGRKLDLCEFPAFPRSQHCKKQKHKVAPCPTSATGGHPPRPPTPRAVTYRKRRDGGQATGSGALGPEGTLAGAGNHLHGCPPAHDLQGQLRSRGG